VKSTPGVAWQRRMVAKQDRCSWARTTGRSKSPLIRQGPEPAGAPDLPGGERIHILENLKLDELSQARLRVRVHHAAAQDLRRFGLVGGSRSHPLIRGRRLAGRPAGWLANEEICHELLANNVRDFGPVFFCLSAAVTRIGKIKTMRS